MFNRFEPFRLALVKNHVEMVLENKCRGIYKCGWRWKKPTLIGWWMEGVDWLMSGARW